jgi:hypothetical protein
MDISLVLAQIVGISLVVVGISMAANSKETAAVVEASAENKATLWMWGVIALVIGATMVVLNNIWTTGLPLIVTIIGWIALVKGVFILFFPRAANALYRRCGKSGSMVLWGVVVLVIGLVLLYW